jgi:hypothetical protein
MACRASLLLVLLVLLVLACEAAEPRMVASEPSSLASTKVEPSEPPPSELARKTCADAPTAIWRGHPPPLGEGLEFPIEYAFEQLVFRFDDGTELPVEPEGILYFSDWRQEIFAPDCKHVALLQDRFGPYHIVAIEHLREYLSGRLPPDYVAAGCSGCTSAAVHSDARWIDADTLEYGLGACGDTWDERFELARRTSPNCPR